MDLLRKQIYEVNFNAIGNFLKDSYEKSKGNKRKTVLSLIKNINEMYMYTNGVDNELLISNAKLSKMRLDKNRAVLRARKAEEKLQELQK
tara:strand:+ start:4297 stop:4566 length:270 start_codon:yes stop_codon:yes gene_type:complete